ncbi:hypothetical protein EVB27_098 [Rhizobium phage RHph_TM16]|nr:hypothetical protein EVB27_098 [Rhizobium phage RHph_TM16]
MISATLDLTSTEREGYNALLLHKQGIDECPYPVNTKLRKQWQRGWRLAAVQRPKPKTPSGDAYQVLTVDTIAGPKKIKAPADWVFDTTAVTAWLWICNYQHDLLTKKFRSIKERTYVEGKIEGLAVVLANAIGMAAAYWSMESKKYAEEGYKV